MYWTIDVRTSVIEQSLVACPGMQGRGQRVKNFEKSTEKFSG